MAHKLPPVHTRFPVNRKDHTQKGPYLANILKKILSGKWEFHDPKVKALLKDLKLKETIATALVLRRVLNATEGDDLAIERIFERVDGKVDQKLLTDSPETKIIIIRDGNKIETLARQVHLQQEEVPGTVLELGDRENSGLNLAGHVIQRGNTE